MDNGRVQQRVNAREMTVEIDRATDLAIAAGAEGLSTERSGFAPEQAEPKNEAAARERAKQMGWQVIDGGKVARNAEGVPRGPEMDTPDYEAAQEILRDEDELVNSTDYVGVETPLQVDERLQREMENLQNEDDPKRDLEARIAHESQEKIARETMVEVNKIVNHKQFSPLELVRLHRKMGNMVLNSYEDPHPIGRGNG